MRAAFLQSLPPNPKCLGNDKTLENWLRNLKKIMCRLLRWKMVTIKLEAVLDSILPLISYCCMTKYSTLRCGCLKCVQCTIICKYVKGLHVKIVKRDNNFNNENKFVIDDSEETNYSNKSYFNIQSAL